jgi:hypothetical protein
LRRTEPHSYLRTEPRPPSAVHHISPQPGSGSPRWRASLAGEASSRRRGKVGRPKPRPSGLTSPTRAPPSHLVRPRYNLRAAPELLPVRAPSSSPAKETAGAGAARDRGSRGGSNGVQKSEGSGEGNPRNLEKNAAPPARSPWDEPLG